MEILFFVLMLIIAVIMADILNKKWGNPSVLFYQIFLGALLSRIPAFHHYLLEPEMFMLAIIAPLLFIDAQEMSRADLKKNIGTTISLAVGLVVVSVLAGGFFISWMIPGLPFALAFVLAAIVSPTDAVAVQSITKDVVVPRKNMDILKSESLFNDASGIVAFNVSLAAFFTGDFSVGSSVLDFFISFFGGLLVGGILGYAIVRLRIILLNNDLEDTSMLVIIQILTPFIIFIIAEEIGVSGILAAVAAGLVHGVEKDLLKLTSTKIRVVTDSTWTVLSYGLNGFVFVLLGLNLPSVVSDLFADHHMDISDLLLTAFILYLILIIIRALWFRVMLKQKNHVLTMSLSGVHGTVALAMALSIPLWAGDWGFPMRNEWIFMASVVILCSLIVPAVIFPLILPRQSNGIKKEDLKAIKAEILAHTISSLQEKEDVDQICLQRVLATLRDQLFALETKRGIKLPDPGKVNVMLAESSRIEEEVVEKLFRENKLSQHTRAFYHQYVLFVNRQISRSGFAGMRYRLMQRSFRKRIRQFKENKQRSGLDSAKNASINSKIKHRVMKLRRILYQRKFKQGMAEHYEHFDRESSREDKKAQMRGTWEELVLAHEAGKKASISYLHTHLTGETYTEARYLLDFYEHRHQPEIKTEQEKQVMETDALFREAFQMEYVYIHDLFEQKKITHETAKQLREQVNYDEMLYEMDE